MKRVIAVTSQKGGVTKTTTAVSIATSLGVDPAPGIYGAFIGHTTVEDWPWLCVECAK